LAAEAQVATLLTNTTYRLVALGPGIGAETVDPNSVFLNTDGAFFNAGPAANGLVTVHMPNAAGVQSTFTFGSVSAFQGFILLHELGHQTGAFGPDVDAGTNGANSQGILDNCVAKNAQGVYM
jgi:hypothetical protein